MATSIPAVANTSISHAILIDITLADTTYYISSAYKPITTGGNTYTELGALLQISNITEDIKTTNGDITVSLSGIPSEADYLNIVLSSPIKGGAVKIQRVFFDVNTAAVLSVHPRYQGIITNFAIDEEISPITGELTNAVSVICASINTLLENRVTGQRTNSSDRKRFYPNDISFDRVAALQNTQFDFGREYAAGGGAGGSGGSGGGRGADDRRAGGGGMGRQGLSTR